MRTAGIFICGLLLMLAFVCAGCGGGEPETQPLSQPASGNVAPAPGGPAFPGDSLPAEVSPARRASGTVAVNGADWTEEEGANNYLDTVVPNAYVIIPGGVDDPYAWAKYSVSDLGAERPVSLELRVTAAPLDPGGAENLPLKYWVGVSNFSDYKWEWHGPFTYEDPRIELNNLQSVRYRCVSSDAAGNTLHLVVVTAASEGLIDENNPDGLAAARIETITVSTLAADSPQYGTTRPHYAAIEAIGPPGGKGPSALDPASQYVQLDWTHHFDPYNSALEAAQYELCRQGPLDETVVPIGSADAPAGHYVDPADNTEGTPEIIPGATYTYSLRATNPTGSTPYAHATYKVPFLPPKDVQASDGLYVDKVALSWTKSEGADAYWIYRDTQDSAFASISDDDANPLDPENPDLRKWDDTALTGIEPHTYWIKARNQYADSDFSQSDIGYLSNDPSDLVISAYPAHPGSNNDSLLLMYAEPVLRRDDRLMIDQIAGTVTPVDQIGYADLLKYDDGSSLAHEFNVHLDASRTVFPKAVFQANSTDPDDITDMNDPDAVPGIGTLERRPSCISLDILAITPPGSPGDPDIPYSYKLFSANGSNIGSGVLYVSPVAIDPPPVIGINWGINLWNRESYPVEQRGLHWANHTINGNTITTGSPDILWVEFGGGQSFDWNEYWNDQDFPPPSHQDNVYLSLADVGDMSTMVMKLRIVGLTATGNLIALHNLERNDGSTYVDWAPSASGILDPGHTYTVKLIDPHSASEWPFIGYDLDVTGTNPNG